MKVLILLFCMFGQIAIAQPPQLIVPNEQDALAAFSNDPEVVRTVLEWHDQGFAAVDTSVVLVSEGTFLVSTYLERRGTKSEPVNLLAVVVYRKGGSRVRLLKAEAVRTALLSLAGGAG